MICCHLLSFGRPGASACLLWGYDPRQLHWAYQPELFNWISALLMGNASPLDHLSPEFSRQRTVKNCRLLSLFLPAPSLNACAQKHAILLAHILGFLAEVFRDSKSLGAECCWSRWLCQHNMALKVKLCSKSALGA